MASTGEITDAWITGSLEIEEDNDMDVDSGFVRLRETMKTVISASVDARLVINHALIEMVKDT